MRSITLFGSTFHPNGDKKFGVPEFTDGQTRVLITDKLEIMTRGGKLKPLADARYGEIIRYVDESNYNLTNHKLLD